MSFKKWSDEELITFVQLYRQEECLWNLKSQNYRNKNMRSAALQNICTAMNIGGLTVDDVKAKIKSLRCTYYLECDKIKKSSSSGAGANVYIPKIKWFSELHEFIKVVAIKRNTTDNYTNENADNDQQSNAEPVEPTLVPTQNELSPRNRRIVGSKKSKLSQMASIVAEMKKVNNSVNEKEENDIDIFGMSVAAQMKKLSEEQEIIARDEIQSTLTRCRLTDLRSRPLPNTQFLSSQFVQLPQSSPADTNTSTASSSLDFYPNNNMSPSETELSYINLTEVTNIIDDAFNNA